MYAYLLYRNNSCGFPMLGLAKIEYWNPYYTMMKAENEGSNDETNIKLTIIFDVI